jgi:hypothetical protein
MENAYFLAPRVVALASKSMWQLQYISTCIARAINFFKIKNIILMVNYVITLDQTNN